MRCILFGASFPLPQLVLPSTTNYTANKQQSHKTKYKISRRKKLCCVANTHFRLVVGNAILNLLHEINFYKIIHITLGHAEGGQKGHRKWLNKIIYGSAKCPFTPAPPRTPPRTLVCAYPSSWQAFRSVRPAVRSSVRRSQV